MLAGGSENHRPRKRLTNAGGRKEVPLASATSLLPSTAPPGTSARTTRVGGSGGGGGGEDVPKTGGRLEKKKLFPVTSAAEKRPATTANLIGKRLDATSVDAHRLAAHKEQRRREIYAWNASLGRKLENEGTTDGSADAV